MKIIVTGAGTPIGNAISKKLLENNHIVICVYNSNFPSNLKKFENFYPQKLDLTKKFKLNLAADALIHCASATPERNNSRELRKINVLGFDCLLKSLDSKRIKKIILMSSIAVYEKNKQNIITECSLPKFKSNYAKSKYDQENVLNKFKQKGLKKIILRLSSVLYKSCKVNFYCRTISNIKNKKKVIIHGGNKSINSVIFLDDLVKIVQHFLISRNKGKNSIINVASKNPKKIKKILDNFYKKLGEKKNYIIKSSKEKNYIFSTKKLSKIKLKIPTVDNTINKFLNDI